MTRKLNTIRILIQATFVLKVLSQHRLERLSTNCYLHLFSTHLTMLLIATTV